MKEYLSKSLEETKKATQDFVVSLKPSGKGATVVGLYGELGSGKTTFMKYLAEELGVKEEVTSPTFVIMKIFDLTQPSPCEGEGKRSEMFERLIHIDAYRIENEEEMLVLGWEEIIADPKNLICIEWPERIAKILPEHIVVKFGYGQSATERKIGIA